MIDTSAAIINLKCTTLHTTIENFDYCIVYVYTFNYILYTVDELTYAHSNVHVLNKSQLINGVNLMKLLSINNHHEL